jgi:hypothetical protein
MLSWLWCNLPRSPILNIASRNLAQYFGAITDADYIERSMDVRLAVRKTRDTRALGSAGGVEALEAQGDVYRAGVTSKVGTDSSVYIADLINGAISIGQVINGKIEDRYRQDFAVYGTGQSGGIFIGSGPGGDLRTLAGVVAERINSSITDPSLSNPNVYAMNVYNPYLGPATRDMGPLEIFMNSIPTLEFSKCVPYVNVDLITAKPPLDNSNNPSSLSLIRFLNPAKVGSADYATLSAQSTRVKSEVLDLGAGTRAGMELFTAPQTLVNLDATGREYVPIIDRMRPLASLGELSISLKMQGNTTSAFTQIRMEITVHDRSRLREIADLVRADLYGRTFLDITYGWSHPEGGLNSKNEYGKFLDAIKVSGRYRIATSSYTFEEGGQIKITLNLFSVGSVDLLSLVSRNSKHHQRDLEIAVRKIREALEEKKAMGLSGPGMTKYDFLNQITDPSSLLKAAADNSFLQAVDKLQGDGKNIDLGDPLVRALCDAFGELALPKGASSWTTVSNSVAGTTGVVTEFTQEVTKTYADAIKEIPKMTTDGISDGLFVGKNIARPKLMYSNAGAKDEDIKKIFEKDYVSLGAAIMKLVAYPLADSNTYEEVQVIFYPFNDYAGAMHGCPLSWFPVDRNRLNTAVAELAKRSPEISLNVMIELLNSRFVGFPAERAYLMADYYDQEQAPKGTAQIKKGNVPGQQKGVTFEAKYRSTLDERLSAVGISEKKFVQPKLGIIVEGSPLLKLDGSPLEYSSNKVSKSLIKIHIFDAASTPYRTLGEILAAARDDQLGVVIGKVSDFNRESYSAGLQPGDIKQRRADLDPILKAAEQAGLLYALDTSGLKNSAGESIEVGPMYAVKGEYKDIKRLVAAGMPTFTYGSSMSGITNASLSSVNSSGAGNAMIVRSFQSPSEVAPENIDGGVPMQLLPAQLSLSTFGCPLFFPMQRVFVDFGTGTSLDNVYFVLGAEHKIGQSGFKTDVKMSYQEGFATYVSLSQNLAMMAARVKNALDIPLGVAGIPDSIPSASKVDLGADQKLDRSTREAQRKYREALEAAGRAIGRSLAPAARVSLEVQAAIAAQVEKVKLRIALEAKEAADAVRKKIESAIPEEVKAKVIELQKIAQQAEVEARSLAAFVAKAKEIAELVLDAENLIAQVGSEAAGIIIASASDEIAKQLKENPPKAPE